MYGYDYDPEDDRPATMSEAVDEWARNVGSFPRYIDQAWLSHDYDVWVKNPHYTGPAQPHPEDGDFDEDDVDCGDMSPESDRQAFADAGMGTDEDYGMFSDNFDDIPF